MMPQWFLLLGIIIATLAAIIASQSLISGAYTLISEAINLGFWQKVSLRQPTELKGQIYIPSINLILWIGTMVVVLYFQNSSAMEAAYGLAITIAMMMTTYLLSFFLLYKLKWNKILVYALIGMFCIIEISFFTANIMKFRDGGFIAIFVAGIFFVVMYVTYYGKKIHNRYTKYVELADYSDKIVELSNDENVPKFSTHLIYLTKAERKDMVESRVIHSIFGRKPKRADIYWFFHINRTNKPYTLDYEVFELVDDKIIKISLNIGFRIQPKTELYFQKIIDDLIANKELNLHLKSNLTTKYSVGMDFKFIVLEKYLSVENEFRLKEGYILKAYFFLKRFALKEGKAFGLDRSDVLIEHFPLIYQPANASNLKRKNIIVRN
jgi:KUP system potassium uptake protein